MKLYKAVDVVDDAMSAFLVYDNGEVAVSTWVFEASEEEVATAKSAAPHYLRAPAERFNDAIDPVLIAEW